MKDRLETSSVLKADQIFGLSTQIGGNAPSKVQSLLVAWARFYA